MTSESVGARPLGWAARRALIVLAAVVTAISILVPVGAFLDARANSDVLRRVQAPGTNLSASTRSFARELGKVADDAPPLILSYHDIRPLAPEDEPADIYTVTPQQFAAHMAALRHAGFRAISSKQMAGWLEGERLPRRSVYITFDDGTTGVWRYADSVLRRHGMRAAVFVITGRAGTHRPYYLNWSELRHMRRTGRWDIESHTRDGHDRIQVNKRGEMEPFLINRRWLPSGHRQETLHEAFARVEDDIAGSRRDLHRNGFATPEFFAYPFSAETKPTNDQRLPPRVAELVRQNFASALSNDEPDRFVSQRDRARRSLARVEVFRFTTAHGLLARINHALPLPTSGLRPLEHVTDWVDSSGRRFVMPGEREARGAMPRSPYNSWVRLEGGELVAKPEPSRYLAAVFAPGRSEDWIDYRATVVASDLGVAEQGPTATLVGLDGAPAPAELAVSAGFARFRMGDRIINDMSIPPANDHTLELEVRSRDVTARVDGNVVGVAPLTRSATGGVALGASGVDPGESGVRFHSLAVESMAPAGKTELIPPSHDERDDDRRSSRSRRSTTTSTRRRTSATTAPVRGAVTSTATSSSLPPESTTSSTPTSSSTTTAPTASSTTSTTEPSTTTTTRSSSTTTSTTSTTTRDRD